MSEARDLVSGLTPPNPLDQWAGRSPPLAVSPDLRLPSAPAAPSSVAPQAKPVDAVVAPQQGQPAPANPAAQVADYFTREFNLPPFVGAGIARALKAESNLDPAAFNPAGGGHGALGIAQHRGARQDALLQSPDAHTLEGQLQFIGSELRGAEKHTLDALGHARNEQEVADIWKTSFERPGEFSVGFRWAQEDRDKHQQSMDSSVGIQREMMRLANEELPGSKERHEMLLKAREAADRANESFEQLRKTPPYYKPVDIMENFGSAAVLISVLGGLFARRPLMASLNAAGLAMGAQNQQRWDVFKAATDQWKTQADMGLAQSKLAHDQIREVMDDEKLAWNEREAKIHTLLSTWQIGEQAKWHDETFRTQRMDAWQRANQHAEDMKQRWEIHVDAMLNAGPARLAQKKADILEEIEAVRALPDDDPTKAAKLKAAEQKQADLIAINSRASAGQGLWSDDAMAALVERAYKGDPSVMQQLPRSGPARKQYEEALAARLKQEPGGIAGGNAMMILNRLRMIEAQHAASRAGSVTMNTEMFAQEAKIAGAEVVRTSEAIPRTEVPRVNQAIEAYYRQSGDPKIIELGLALTQFYNAYGKMSNPTGTGIHDADKERIQGILDASLSKRQISGGVEQVIREGMGVSLSAENAQIELLRRLAPSGENLPPAEPPRTLPAPGTPGAPVVTPQGVGTVGSAGASMPVPSGFAGDPDGTGYRKDGQVWVKRGDTLILTPGATETPR